MKDIHAPIVVGAKTTNRPIVVGVDDTPAGRAALRFALQEATRRGSALDIVTAWTWHALADAPGPDDGREWTRAYAQEVQDQAVAAVLSDFDELPVLSRQVVEGDAAQVLVRMTRGAGYLVVGRAHKGPVRRLLLGSVSEYCIRHASCPVLVVPAPAVAEGVDNELVTAHEH
jgi:nucleotide-binding universal stress UspA family protein